MFSLAIVDICCLATGLIASCAPSFGHARKTTACMLSFVAIWIRLFAIDRVLSTVLSKLHCRARDVEVIAADCL